MNNSFFSHQKSIYSRHSTKRLTNLTPVNVSISCFGDPKSPHQQTKISENNYFPKLDQTREEEKRGTALIILSDSDSFTHFLLLLIFIHKIHVIR